MLNGINSGRWGRWLLPLMTTGIMAGCAGHHGVSQSLVKPEALPETVGGYLSAQQRPNSLALLPPAPSTGSAAQALDDEISQRSFALRDTPRWLLASSDASVRFPHAASLFSCALGTTLVEKDTPRLHQLLRRTVLDVGRSTLAAKQYYKRARPFVVNKQPLCTPNAQAQMEKDGSYPSGHAAVGWAWALVLSEISPDDTDAILARGLALGESRNVCNVHWHSDVVQGRVLAAGTVARLHAEPAFRADLEAARVELAALRSKGLKPTIDCAAQAAVLGLQPSLAQ